jgi:MFS family permease
MSLLGQPRGSQPPGNWTSWIIWGTAAVFYLYEFFVRVAPSVMQEPLMEVMHVNAAGFGLAMGVYYYVYSPLQLVAGTLLDRYGARLVLLPSVLVVATGCLLEALGQNMVGVAMARGLQGLGSAFAFVGAMYLAAQWFPHGRLALIAGLTTALGMAGGIMGNAGLEWLIEVEGWRATLHFSWMAGAVVFFLMLAVIPAAPPWAAAAERENPEAPPPVSLLGAIFKVLRNPQTLIIGLIGGILYLPLTVVGGLWGESYITAVSPMSPQGASNAVSMLYVGWLAGAPLAGWLSDRVRKRRLFLVTSTVLTLVTTLFLTSFTALHPATMFGLLLVVGLASSMQVVTFVSAIEANDPLLHGTALSANNMMVMLIGGLAQPLFGWILDWSAGRLGVGDSYTAEHYRTAMILLPAAALIGVIASFFLKESFRHHEGPVGH